MFVTKFNQNVAFDEFKKALESCEFCAFDEEMTGVDCDGAPRLFGQSAEAVYAVRKQACEEFNAFQFGLAVFIPHGDGESYDVQPYNFNVLNSEGSVCLDLKCIPFHTSNNMDFQKWLSSGLRYCTAEEEAKLRSKFAKKPNLTQEADKTSFEKVMCQIKTWYTSEKEEEKSLTVSEPCSFAVAKAVKFTLEAQSEMAVTCHYDGKPYFAQNMVFTIDKIPTEQFAALRAQESVDVQRRLRAQLGFREFWKALVESGKPIVGHNCFQDILFMMHMHEQNLPQEYSEFKALVQRTFPSVYDTKTLAAVLTGECLFAQTHLGAVYQEVRRRFNCGTVEKLRAVFRLPAGFYDYDEEVLKGASKAHEAGYDAYMTGICFHFLRKLHNGSESSWKNVVAAFGSVFYCYLAEEEDRLVVPATFIIRSSTPFHLEQLESILFTSQDPEKVTVGGKIDVRKLTYKLAALQQTDEGLITSVCAVFTTEETIASVQNIIKAAAVSDAATNVAVSLVPFLSVDQAF